MPGGGSRRGVNDVKVDVTISLEMDLTFEELSFLQINANHQSITITSL